MSNDNLALLAAASYGEFSEINNKKEIQNSLKKVEISEFQANKFTDTYEILAHKPNTEKSHIL
ncbi:MULTISPECIES: hypothetical protein [Glaesserella]|uniref:Uncharacterized protein n=1 Tax=Glaesserella australis TaxID=2094024 RepID=A0A328C075_9PAST|nr:MULTISPECIES: hypothetical protein [Glaesserella]AUI66239.1 hypothetical protein CJD39_06425 [Glaesserella sp. 15-184]RAL19261.1 hypothetical protein C5N92_03850 [Glaesserella australis]